MRGWAAEGADFARCTDLAWIYTWVWSTINIYRYGAAGVV